MKNQANNFLVKLLLYALGYGLLAYAASRTLDFIQSTMPPDKQWWGYLFLLATGGGAVIWSQVFMKHAHGAKRRGISFGMAIVDLLGEFAMVYADTMTTSADAGMIQQLNPEFLRTFILASVGIIGLNILAFFFYELWDPEKEQERRAQDIGDGIEAEAMKMLGSPELQREMIARHSPEIQAAIMAKVAMVIAERFTGPTSSYTQPTTHPAPAARPQLQGPVAPQTIDAGTYCNTCRGYTWSFPGQPHRCGNCLQPYDQNNAALREKLERQRSAGMIDDRTYQLLSDQITADEHDPRYSYHPVDLAPKSKPAPEYGDAWRNSTDITPTLAGYAWECLGCGGSNGRQTRSCQWCGQPRTNGNPVTAIADIPPAGQNPKSPQEAPERKTIFDFPGILANILEKKPQARKQENPPAGDAPFPAR
jgi:hypothetical protein